MTPRDVAEIAQHQDDQAMPEVAERGSLFRARQVLLSIREPLAVCILSTIAFIVGFAGGPGRLGIPLGTGDLLGAYLAAKVWGDGSPFGNASLGYPWGVELRYYPTVDLVQNGLAGLIAAITDNPFFGLNAVYAASFPMAAIAAWWVLRLSGLRGPIAVFGSLAFTVIPYHWLRLEHVYLGTMYSAALGVGLAIMVGTGDVERRLKGPRRIGWAVLLAGIALVVATSGIYYACFTVLLCVAALVYRFGQGAGWRRLGVSALPGVVVTVFTALALAPAWYYERTHPALEAVADRAAWESVTYSGIFSTLLLPAPFSKVPGFGPVNAAVTDVVAAAAQLPVGTSVGVLWYADFGSLFTVLALALMVIGILASSRRRAMSARVSAERPAGAVSFGLVGTLLGTAILFFVPWGLNFLFAHLVTGQLRGWDRLVPVIFMLVFVGATVAWRELRLPTSGRRSYVTAGVMLVLLTLDSVIPYRATFDAAAETGGSSSSAGEAYATALNAAVPGRCGVLQLPYLGYPEVGPSEALAACDQLWPALTNPEKDWSYGAIKGTVASAWLARLGNDVNPAALDDLALGGFCAVHVDLRGFTAADGEALVATLTSELGPPVAVGHDGSWLAFAISGSEASEPLDEASLARMPDDLQVFFAPPRFAQGPGALAQLETDAFHELWWLTGESTSFAITSIDDDADFALVSAQVMATGCAPREVRLTLTTPTETVERSVSLDPGQTRGVTLRLDDPATSARLSVEADGALCAAPDGRQLSIALIDPAAGY